MDGRSIATDTPTIKGEKSLKVVVVFNIFLPRNSKTIQVATEIATILTAASPCTKIDTASGTHNIIAKSANAERVLASIEF